MHKFPIHKRIYYRFLGVVFGLTYWTNRHKFLGFRLSTGVKALAFGPLLLAWRQNRSNLILGLALALGLWVLWLYWRAKRVGYNWFVAGDTDLLGPVSDRAHQRGKGTDHNQALPPDELTPLPPNQRIALKASGIFSVSDREEQILMCPAEYWRVPRGEHTLMAQPERGRFVYQFFSATTLQNVRRGWFIHGLTPQSVLAVTFLSSWGAEALSLRMLYQGGDAANQNTKQRTIYLCFDDKNDERAVWHTIVHDAREKRKA